mmetsp:Transcript_129492/g.223759  ORF Transcript_129492/g.223759 Transcript_129492/m.223759 type:complete len:114 (-) Transcript_129492:1970-2311(-)
MPTEAGFLAVHYFKIIDALDMHAENSTLLSQVEALSCVIYAWTIQYVCILPAGFPCLGAKNRREPQRSAEPLQGLRRRWWLWQGKIKIIQELHPDPDLTQTAFGPDREGTQNH